MFGSAILDVAMGLVFAFLMISLVTSAATESIASALSWRANTLLQGVKDLLNDPKFSGLALRIYNHAAVNARSSGSALSQSELTVKPSYIDAKQFATALIDVTGLLPGTSVPALQSQIKAAVPDSQLNEMLNGIVARTGGNVNRVRDEIADWFDSGMDRVAGVYKRKTQLCGVLIGFGLAIALNVDAVKIARTLWSQPMVMKGFSPPSAGETAQRAIAQLQGVGVPFGWDDNTIRDFKAGPSWNWLSVVVGWLITSVATLFGAPFWFDALQKFVQLRGAGSK